MAMTDAERIVLEAKADRSARQVHYIVWPAISFAVVHGLAWTLSRTYRALPPWAPLGLAAVTILSSAVIGWNADSRTVKETQRYASMLRGTPASQRVFGRPHGAYWGSRMPVPSRVIDVSA